MEIHNFPPQQIKKDLFNFIQIRTKQTYIQLPNNQYWLTEPLVSPSRLQEQLSIL